MKRLLLAAPLLVLIGYAAWSYTTGGALYLMLAPNIKSELRLIGIQNYFDSWGAAAPIGYMLLVTVEVILAPIPGAVLYLPGGAIFGWALGGALSLIGNVAGAGIACQLMRAFGRRHFERYLEAAALKKYQTILEQRGIWVVLLLRVNPLTSSDLVSYAAGLTRLPIWRVMTGTALGMAPLCFIQSYFAQEILVSFPGLVYPLSLIGIAYTVYVFFFLHKLSKSTEA